MADIDISVSSGQAKTEIAELNKDLKNVGVQFKEITSVINEFNKKGVLVESTVKGIDAAGRTLTVTMEKLKAGLTATNTQVAQNFKQLNDLKAPLNSLGDIITRLSTKYKDLEVAQTKANDKGVISSAKITALDEFNKKVTFTVKNVEGLLKVVDKTEGKTVKLKSVPLPVIPTPKDFVSGSSKTTSDFIRDLSSEYSKLRVATESVNNAGKTYSATLKGQAKDGREVSIALRSVNGELSKVGTSIRDTSEIKRPFEDLKNAVDRVQRSLQYFVTYRAFATISDQVKQAFNSIREYQIQISLIRTLSQENQLSFNQWSQEIKKVSDELGTPLQDTAEATFLTISNQVAKGRQAIEFVREASQLSRTTGATTAQAANLLSSAINAYGKSASDAAELSALFFKTIDEGRVVAGELSDTFGGVAVLGKELGVSLNDLNATLAFITQSGVKTDTAMTFLRNTFLQLEKPSEALSAYFEKIGVSSGKAAITASGGFGGFIQRLIKDIKEGNLEIAKLFPELRGQQAIVAAFGRPEELDAITKRFNDLSATAQNFKNAIEIRDESDANTINKELNKLANTLTVDIGGKLAKLTKDILLFAGGGKSLSEGLNELLVRGRNVLIFYAAYKATVIAATGIQLGYAAAIGSTGIGLGTMTVATNAATVSTLRFNAATRASIIGLAVGLGAYLGARKAFSDDLITEASDKIDALDEHIKKRRKAFETRPVTEPAAVDTFLGGLTKEFAGAAGALAEFQKRNNAALEDIRAKNQKNAAAVGESFKLYVESLKNGLEDLRRKISESRTLIADLTKSMLEFRRATEQSTQNTRFKFGTDFQKLKFLDEQISKNQDQAKSLFDKGDKDSIAEANKLLEETLRLLEQRDDLIIQGKKNQIEGKPQDPRFNAELNRRREADFKGGRDFQGNPILEIDIERIRKRNATLADLQEQLSKKLIDIKKKEVAELQAIEDKEKVRIQSLEKAFKDFNEFSAFDKGGNIKGEFKDKVTGRVDPEKVKAALEEVSAKLREVAGNDFRSRFDLEQILGQRRKDILAEVNAAERVELIRNHQIKLDQLKEFYEKQANANKDAIKAAAASASGSIQNQRDRTGDLDALLVEAERRLRDQFKKTTGLGDKDPLKFDFDKVRNPGFLARPDIQNAKASQQAYRELVASIQAYKDALNELANDKNKDNVQGQLVPKPEVFQKAEEAYERFRKALFETDNSLRFGKVPGSQAGATFDDSAGLLRAELNNIKRQIIEAERANVNQKLLADQFQSVQSKLDEIKRAFPEAAKAASDAIGASTDKIGTFIQSLNALTNQLNNIKPAGGGKADGNVPGFAEGGFVGGRPGVDTNLARLTRGEYVVNARSAYQFADVLTAINRTRGNVNTVRGGDIMNTRVGDVVINYNGTNSTENDAKALGREFKRQIRRGNF